MSILIKLVILKEQLTFNPHTVLHLACLHLSFLAGQVEARAMKSEYQST